MKKILSVILLIGTVFGCAKTSTMTIEPIDKELNGRLLTGKNLDTRLFSTKDLLQYYEVSDFSGLNPAAIQEKIDSFIKAKYKSTDLSHANQITFLFYKKDLFTDYGKYVYEAARDTEAGFLSDYPDKLVSQVEFLKIKGDANKVLRRRTVYQKEEILLSKEDTLNIKAVFRM